MEIMIGSGKVADFSDIFSVESHLGNGGEEFCDVFVMLASIQGDPAPCSKPLVDIDLKLRFSIRTQLSHQCQLEVLNKVLGLPVQRE